MIYLRELDISDNNVSDVDDIIDSVEILNLSKNCILDINKLPLSLKEIISYNNRTYKITDKFPKNLTKIDFYNNNSYFVLKFVVCFFHMIIIPFSRL